MVPQGPGVVFEETGNRVLSERLLGGEVGAGTGL